MDLKKNQFFSDLSLLGINLISSYHTKINVFWPKIKNSKTLFWKNSDYKLKIYEILKRNFEQTVPNQTM